MRHLLACTAIAPVLVALTATNAAAETTIGSSTTTAVKTSTVASGAADAITVSSAGSITLTSGTAITMDSNNNVSNAGSLTINDADNATGILVKAGTTGNIQRDRTESGVPYRASAKYNRIGLFGDYRPFGGRFRLTAGLTINDASVKLDSRFDGVTPVTINETTITPTAADYFKAHVKIPRLTPYFGIGWGNALTPNKRWIHDVGLEPDVAVAVPTPPLKLNAAGDTE